MSESFTPGPWLVREFPAGRGGRGKLYVMDSIPDGPDGKVRANLIASETTCLESKANARLIAAAPDLYEALCNMLSGWRYIREVHGNLYGVGWNSAQDAAEAALAKVHGAPANESQG